MMLPDLQSSLICDDVRQERNGKFMLIGLFDDSQCGGFFNFPDVVAMIGDLLNFESSVDHFARFCIGDHRHPEEVSHARPDLRGIAIDGLFPEEDQIDRIFEFFECKRKRVGSRPGIRSAEFAVGNQNGLIRACSSGLRVGDSPVVPQGMMMSVPASA